AAQEEAKQVDAHAEHGSARTTPSGSSTMATASAHDDASPTSPSPSPLPSPSRRERTSIAAEIDDKAAGYR
ncbi:unnamed protein product, partial [Amoebophrya sp. A25]